MTHHHSTLRTPMWQDKRFITTLVVILAVLVLVAFNRAPNEEVLTFLALTVAAFLGQSQYGQTKRTTELLKAAADAPPEQP